TANAKLALRTQARTYRVNRGPRERSGATTINRGFTVKAGTQTVRRRGALHSQWVDDSQPAPYGFLLDTATNPLHNIWLAAPKTTDALFIAPTTIPLGLKLHAVGIGPNRDLAVRAAALSGAYTLVFRAALELDVDPEEFDVLEP